MQLSDKVVSRLSLYRRLLVERPDSPPSQIYSHELAKLACVSSAQVRRDMMAIAYSGTPNRGYDVKKLVEELGKTLDDPAGTRIALVGIGNLGRALISFFSERRSRLAVRVGFDIDPEKVNRVLFGCRCHAMDKMAEVIRAEQIRTAILTVPAREAQRVTDQLIQAGILGILNFAAVPLRVPPHVYLMDQDMTMALETVAFFTRQGVH